MLLIVLHKTFRIQLFIKPIQFFIVLPHGRISCCDKETEQADEPEDDPCGFSRFRTENEIGDDANHEKHTQQGIPFYEFRIQRKHTVSPFKVVAAVYHPDSGKAI